MLLGCAHYTQSKEYVKYIFTICIGLERKKLIFPETLFVLLKLFISSWLLLGGDFHGKNCKEDLARENQ